MKTSIIAGTNIVTRVCLINNLRFVFDLLADEMKKQQNPPSNYEIE